MANNTTVLMDTNRRFVVKFVGAPDSAGLTLKIDAGSLKGALNANNLLLGTGTDRKAAYRLTLQELYYDVSGAANFVALSTDGDATANIIYTMSTGQAKIGFIEGGERLTIPVGSGANSTGNLWLSVTGTPTYTVIADFRKNNDDYDAGQFNDPMAFNRSPRGVNG